MVTGQEPREAAGRSGKHAALAHAVAPAVDPARARTGSPKELPGLESPLTGSVARVESVIL